MSRRIRIRGRDLAGRSGVGAIFEVGMQSFVVADIAHWGSPQYKGKVIQHERLAAYLGVQELRGIPGKGDGGPAVVRFPRWMFCVGCKSLQRRSGAFTSEAAPRCDECGRELVGMRWVVACRAGHLYDVPWHEWAHLNRERRTPRDPSCRGRRGLRFAVRAGVGSDHAQVIECRDCGKASSLVGLSGSGTLAAVGMTKCAGLQPWYRSSDADRCEEEPFVLQRASSRLHFPQVMSMIEIPPEADRPLRDLEANEIRQLAGDFTWRTWVDARKRGEEPLMLDEFVELHGLAREAVLAAIDSEAGPIARPAAGRSGALAAEDSTDVHQQLLQEWTALMTPRPERPAWSRFVTDHRDVSLLGLPFSRLVDRLVLVERLREVRAFYGYRRLERDRREGLQGAGRLDERGRQRLQWMPAHEVIGEGIFLNLREEEVRRWASDPAVADRMKPLHDRYLASTLSGSREADTIGHELFPVLHTFAHMLVRELAFSVGYSAASLRERVYVGATDTGRFASGILIYTAEGDSEGTLGGLVRAGEPARMAATLSSMRERASWCGQDPVCRESDGQGYLALNLAACHGCLLVSETSCIHRNVLLDRLLIVGGGPTPGLLGD